MISYNKLKKKNQQLKKHQETYVAETNNKINKFWEEIDQLNDT